MTCLFHRGSFQRASRVLFVVAGFAAPMTAVTAAESLVEALAGGKVSGQLRYRYELVDQEGLTDKAKASTLRTQLGYATGDFYDVGAFVQFEDVHVVGKKRALQQHRERTRPASGGGRSGCYRTGKLQE